MTLAITVGGILDCEYSETLYGNRHTLRLAVAPFDPNPSGTFGDYVYNGSGPTHPTENGVLATFHAIGRLWAPYYPSLYTLRLVRVWRQVAGAAVPLASAPTDPGVPGTYTGDFDPLSVVKRRIELFSTMGTKWSIWLQQIPASPVGMTVATAPGSGGYDARDQAWYAYLASGVTGLVARDGAAFQPGGRVRAWWDRPMAPVVPYVYSG
jgi:hypothetical protein